MQRKRLIASVAVVPLLAFAHGAWAQATITTAVTDPVTTADPPGDAVNSDVTVTSSGSIKPTVTGPALLMNTDNNITNEGTIQTTGVDGSVGMQAAGGLDGDILHKGVIREDEVYPAEGTDLDTDDDGDPDGPFAQGTGRYGIRVTAGTGALEGDITTEAGSSIVVEGNSSYGIRLESGLTGTLMHRGAISLTGDNNFGIRTQGEIDEALDVRGAVTVQGAGAVGVSVEGDVDDIFRIQGAVTALGYRSATAPGDVQTAAGQTALDKLDADDLLQGGPAVQVKANVGGGVLIDSGRPADADDEDTDEDDDGILDALEGAGGSITVYGSAPALLIGGSSAITLGEVGTDDDEEFGLINKGSITASGVYEDVGAVGLQIGTGTATTATIEGGVRNEGSIVATAVDDNATGIRVTQGGQLGLGGVGGVLVNAGTIGAQSIAVNSFTSDLPLPGKEENNTATAISIEAGGAVSGLVNNSVITAIAAGENGNAVAIKDASGTLLNLTNTGKINAIIQANDSELDTDDDDIDPNNETITGTRTAIDLSAATQAITIVQNGVDDGDDNEDEIDDPDADDDGVDDADEPLINGDIKLGSGADTVSINNGQLLGNLYLGGGANTLNIDGGAVVQGRILDTTPSAGVSVNLNDGRLIVTDTDTIYGGNLDVGADGILVVSIDADAAIDSDPDTNPSTKFVVDDSTFATGSQVAIISKGLLTFENLGQPTESVYDFVIVDADNLTVGTIDQSLLGVSPYIYDVSVRVEEADDDLVLRVGRRKAADIGMNKAQAAAYDAVYEALGEDEGLRDAILSQFDRSDFLEIYNQLLPDQGEGLFSSLDMAQIAISRAIATKPDLRQRYGPDSLWVQELNFQVKRDQGETLGSDAKGIGLVGGYEAMSDKGGALGITLAYLTVEESDEATKVGEQTNATEVEVGLYWRQAAGQWLFSLRGGAGYAWLDGTRKFIDADTGLIRTAVADWTGYTLTAHAGVQYEQRFGRFYARPGAYLDYIYFNEGERQESGGAGLDQTVEARNSSRFSGTVELALGAEYGRDFWWRPEVRVGYRQNIAGQIGDTVARFPGGSPFTLVADEPDGAAIVALALKMGTPMSYLAIEGEMESADGEQRYNAKLSGRMMF